MGVQKSKASSIHKYTRLFIRVKKKKQKLIINKRFKFFKFITKFAHLVNLLLEYLLWCKTISFLELFFQLCIAYNLIQLFKQVNFFFTLAYFLSLVVFIGLGLLLYDLDLGAIILWAIYGGVIIVFFLFATMWSETVKSNIFFYDYRLLFFLFYIIVSYIFISIVDDFEDFYKASNVKFQGVYNNLDYDLIEELEFLGSCFFFYSLFYFILCTIALVVSCFSIVIIILTLKKLKANSFVSYLFYCQAICKEFAAILLKNQHFFHQEQDITYLKNSRFRVRKISIKFHRNKTHYRRI